MQPGKQNQAMCAHVSPRRTKLSSTILRPALSKSTVSLLPSAVATVPVPNFAKHPRAFAKVEPALELAISSPRSTDCGAPGSLENSRDGPALAHRRAASRAASQALYRRPRCPY
jgi:hypothetical protein